jgi:exoribonuclease R
LAAPDLMALGLARIREEFEVPSAFPIEVERAAASAARRGPDPGLDAAERHDRRGLRLVTLDPPGSRDLDQAFALVRRGPGWTVWYAIADVASHVEPGGALDAETRRRGVTLYLPDGRVPLHPTPLSEGAGSLLPDDDRPALLWRLEIDESGRLTSGRVRRAVVRSRAQLDYPSVQAELGDGAEGGGLAAALREVGTLLIGAEMARGGVSLPLPDQVVEPVPGAPERYRLAWRRPLPVELWNAQLSLLCGRAAANLMLQGGVGVLRALPPFYAEAVRRLRRAATALGVAWPGSYPAFIRSLDPSTPAGAALLNQAARAMRGAGYVAFGPGIAPPPKGKAARHAAVAAPYAHVTAPLRRLVDRAASEVALAVATRVDVPVWALAALGELPDLMGVARRRESDIDRAVVDLAEAVVLSTRIGEVLDAVVVDTDKRRGSDLQLLEPPVRARTTAVLPLGAEVRVRVEAFDVAARQITLAPS